MLRSLVGSEMCIRDRGHLAQENSARSHFEVAWPGKTRPEVTSKSLGSRKLGSRSLRDHLAQENSARSHFEVTWPGKARPEVTSKSLGSREPGSKSLRGRISMSLQSHFEVTWLEKTRAEVTSKFRNYAKKLLEKTVPVPLNSEALSSAPPRTEDGYPRVHTSMYVCICIYIYIYIYL